MEEEDKEEDSRASELSGKASTLGFRVSHKWIETQYMYSYNYTLDRKLDCEHVYATFQVEATFP